MSNQHKKVLLVEDEKHIAEGIKLNLKLKGLDVVLAEDGRRAISLWKDERPDLIILDIMIPIVDGKKVLEKIREEDPKIPVLILTARGTLNDRVSYFSKGADDYLGKPFDLEELLLRVDRLLLRSEWSNDQSVKGDIFQFGKNFIDFNRSMGSNGEEDFDLTAQEIKLLKVFIENQGIVLKRKDLLDKAWGYSEQTSTRTLDNFIVRFRKYFESNTENRYFRSIRSVGYIFEVNENK